MQANARINRLVGQLTPTTAIANATATAMAMDAKGPVAAAGAGAAAVPVPVAAKSSSSSSSSAATNKFKYTFGNEGTLTNEQRAFYEKNGTVPFCLEFEFSFIWYSLSSSF
jgi:hypothetical protein